MKKKTTKKKSVSKTPKKAKKTVPHTINRAKQPVTPLGDRVLVRPDREEERRVGALIIPVSGEREKPDTGTVVAVGDGKYVEGRLVPVAVKPGDKVMFSKYGYDELKVEGEDLYILREDSILAIINK